MKLSAIDIGSNAARFQISNVVKVSNLVRFKRVEYIRFPLRLGQDVFKDGIIGEKKIDQFVQLLRICKMLNKLHEVSHCAICATSAMREAKNSQKVVNKIKKSTGFEVEVISGEREAELIDKAILEFLDDRNYIHIDVGGGSTELNIYKRRKKIAAESFAIGTVRNVPKNIQNPEQLRMQNWVEKFAEIVKIDFAIGTGGNIKKLQELAEYKETKPLSYKKISSLKTMLESYTLEQRIQLLMLNEDRADVIVPASEIYLSCMKWTGVEKIKVPNVGLKDGIIADLYKKVC